MLLSGKGCGGGGSGVNYYLLGFASISRLAQAGAGTPWLVKPLKTGSWERVGGCSARC